MSTKKATSNDSDHGTDECGASTQSDRFPRSVPVATVVLAVVVVLSGCTGGGVLAPKAADAAGEEHSSSGESPPTFEEVAVQKGFEYETTGPNVGNGKGAVLVADYDNDGRTDVLTIGGDRPQLFRNTKSGFERTNALPALTNPVFKGGLFFDYDNDGWQDLLLLPRGSEAVFLENDGGTFRVRDIGLSVNLTWGTSAAAADYNQDGCLDVFITQNGDWRDTVPHRAQGKSLRHDNGNRNYLFRGNCSEFERVENAGIGGEKWSLATSFVDFTGDGWPDIHVANDFNYDVIYVNQRDGTFTRRRVDETNRHGMASEVADVNGDGRPDIFVTNIEYKRPERVWLMQNGLDMKSRGNNLLINRGNATFRDAATAYGVRRGGWGWSGNLVDLDNDGDLDLVHTTQDYNRKTGSPTNSQQTWKPTSKPPALWMRANDSFERINATRAGFEPSNGRGLAVLDYDKDGDRDLVVADASGKFKLYENRHVSGNWLQVQVKGTANQTAVGARVFVTTDAGTQIRYRNSRTNYFSQNSRTLHFGLANHTVRRVRVVWPDGTEHTFTNVSTNQSVVVRHDGSVTGENRTSVDGS
ncbi:CRTAC1 family protein [Halorussus salinisoli]|uniref:CRTAC1 family protein n=1 Tax=Halorussus salinisoli TaxID=2558242 RepID=UPI0010C1C9CD|nr:CRTAC1 family protein [Halorussus salinisoli]